jgi:hypothetical protein
MPENHSCMNTITTGNLCHYQWSTPVAARDKLSSNHGVMTENQRQAWPEELNITSSHRPRWWEEPSLSSNPQSDITREEHLKILFRTLSTLFKITSLYSLREYALYEFMETNTFSVRTPERHRNFWRSHSIQQHVGFNPHLPSTFILGRYRRGGYEVHRYITTSALPDEEWSEERPWSDEKVW